MKKQKLMVQRMAKNVSLMRQDLRSDYPMNYLAEKELSTLVKKVSPQLYGGSGDVRLSERSPYHWLPQC